VVLLVAGVGDSLRETVDPTTVRRDVKRRVMDPMWKYVACAYLAFWAIILVLGGMASIVFDAPAGVMNAISILGSWSPTIVLLLMLKRLKPGMTVAGFYRRAFRAPLNVRVLVAIPVIVFGVFLAVWLLSAIGRTRVSNACGPAFRIGPDDSADGLSGSQRRRVRLARLSAP
jgi:hypothetical protein